MQAHAVIVRTDVSTWTYASGPGGEMNRRMADCPDPSDHRRAGVEMYHRNAARIAQRVNSTE